MLIGKKFSAVDSVANLEEGNYTMHPKLGSIYKRLVKGREQFERVMSKNIAAVMQISSLDLILQQQTDHMVSISDSVNDATETIESAAQESSAAVEEIHSQYENLTGTIAQAAEEIGDINTKIGNSQQELSVIRDLSSTTIEESKNMQKDMDALMEVINRINEVISGINSISSQTNLLAINASIEAARAGAAGKGFAVVAVEIRELAVATQEMTSSMEQFVESIKQASEKSSASVISTIEALNTMTEKIGNVWKINDENQKNMAQVNSSISALAAVSEELNSSMAEMESQSISIQEQCTTLSDNTRMLKQVGTELKQAIKPVVSIEQMLDESTKQLGDMTDDAFFRMEYKEFVGYMDRAINAHQAWLSNLQKMVQTRTLVPLQFDAAKCGFGHFYYSMTPKTPEIREIWVKIEEKHKKFHNFGAQAKQCILKGDFAGAERSYQEAEQHSKELIGDFQKMKAIAAQHL